MDGREKNHAPSWLIIGVSRVLMAVVDDLTHLRMLCTVIKSRIIPLTRSPNQPEFFRDWRHGAVTGADVGGKPVGMPGNGV